MNNDDFITLALREIKVQYRTDKVGRFRRKCEKAILRAVRRGEYHAYVSLPFFDFNEFEYSVMLNHFPKTFGCKVGVEQIGEIEYGICLDWTDRKKCFDVLTQQKEATQ